MKFTKFVNPETERLILREFTIDDLEAFAPIMADQEVMRFSVNGPLTKSESKDYLHNRIYKNFKPSILAKNTSQQKNGFLTIWRELPLQLRPDQ